MTESSALIDVINELISTERSYVRRLRILKHDYADPLRKFSRNKDTAILPPYEAKILFGNVDSLLPVNEAFLVDLEKMIAPNGPKAVGGIGDVALRHFRDLRGFEHYRGYYDKREEAQSIFLAEMAKKSSGFGAYIDVRAPRTRKCYISSQIVVSVSNTLAQMRETVLACESC
jgi:hypothetical protein